MTTMQAYERIRAFLAAHDELRRKPWRGSSRPLAGHCYVAAEALYHATGGAKRWIVCRLRHEGATHWFLRDRRNRLVMDPTAEQFDTAPRYEAATPTGFLTRKPSRRARIVMEAI